MALDKLITKNRTAILALARKHGAIKIAVFGSMARGDAGPNSDVDFLVELDENHGLLDRISLMQDLEDLLHKKIEVANAKALYKPIRDSILKEAVSL